jgi:hypothetical protein
MVGLLFTSPLLFTSTMHLLSNGFVIFPPACGAYFGMLNWLGSMDGYTGPLFGSYGMPMMSS